MTKNNTTNNKKGIIKIDEIQALTLYIRYYCVGSSYDEEESDRKSSSFCSKIENGNPCVALERLRVLYEYE